MQPCRQVASVCSHAGRWQVYAAMLAGGNAAFNLIKNITTRELRSRCLPALKGVMVFPACDNVNEISHTKKLSL